MRILYHFWLSPACRKVRVMMHEKNLPVDLKLEKIWERRPEFVALNPASEVPVMIEDNGQAIIDGQAICEYLEELYPTPHLLGRDVIERAEIRRLVAWFDHKFNREVSVHLVDEKNDETVFGIGRAEFRRDSCGQKQYQLAP
jgi:glutathione S-transferase